MKSVVGLQNDFQIAVLADDRVPNLFVREGLDVIGGFDIYLNAYRARLIEALKDNFPVLFLAVGDQLFDQMATSYIEQRPSTHRSIRWFGHDLRAFLDQNPDLLPHPAIADLASMDWALRGAFDAADAECLATQDLAAIVPEKWPQMKFDLHPSVTLLDLNWRVGPIWHELNENAEAVTEQPDEFVHTVLIWRQGLECKWRSMEVSDAQALHAVARGQSFAEICDGLAESSTNQADADPTHLAVILLSQWVAEGLLVSVTVDG